MQVRVETTSLGRHEDDAVVLLGTKGERLTKQVGSAGKGFKPAYAALVGRKVFTGGAGQVQVLHGGGDDRIPTLVLAGLGHAKEVTEEVVRHAASGAARAARAAGASAVTFVLPQGSGAAFRPDRAAEAIVEGAYQGLYRFESYKGKKAEGSIDAITVLTSQDDERRAARGAKEGRILGDAVCFARTLGNEPGNTATPTFLAEQAEAIAEEVGLDARILDEDEMAQLGMGSLLGVSQGSAEPAKLIMLTYTPKRKGSIPTVAIVGKGLTFDTGGISIKPANKMEDMKFDMCGGAAVLGAMKAVGQLKPKVRVVGLVPSSENMPGAKAYKPGDILEAMNGVTIEVRNTDAEGRLILADAMAYATSKLKPKPKAIIDLATLTGACVVALGDQHGALISNDEKLAKRLLQASDASGDALWRMPINDGYRKQLDSPYADVSNLGTPGAGTLTAAAFLEKFTGDVPWAHLDIAGMAWTDKNAGYHSRGATGFGVRVIAKALQAW